MLLCDCCWWFNWFGAKCSQLYCVISNHGILARKRWRFVCHWLFMDVSWCCVVQYFFKHSVTLCNLKENLSSKLNVKHMFAYVCWKQKHPIEEWFGISATVCVNLFEPTLACNFFSCSTTCQKSVHIVWCWHLWFMRDCVCCLSHSH